MRLEDRKGRNRNQASLETWLVSKGPRQKNQIKAARALGKDIETLGPGISILKERFERKEEASGLKEG